MSNRLTAKPSASSPSPGDVIFLDGATGVRALDAGYPAASTAAHNADPAAHGAQIAAATAAQVAGLKTEFAITNRMSAPVVFLGDSLIDGQVETHAIAGPRSWANQTAFRSAGRIRMRNNAGVAGNTAAQARARIASDVVAFSPRYCAVMVGTNDCASQTAVSTTITSVVGIYRDLLAAGIEPIAVTIPPIDAEPANTLATALNAEIRRVAAALGLRLVDVWASVRNPTTGLMFAQYAADSLHFSELGAEVAADAFLAQANLPDASPEFLPVIATDKGTAIDLFNDANADGIPDNWENAVPAAGMSFECVEGVWTITKTGGNQIICTRELGAAPAVGTRLALACRLSVTHGDADFAPQVYLQTETATESLRICTGWTRDFTDSVRYWEWVVPEGSTTMTLVVYAAATGVGSLSLSRLRLFVP